MFIAAVRFVKKSEILPVSIAIIGSIVVSITSGIIYVLVSPAVKDPIYQGTAEVTFLNGTASKAENDTKKFTIEIVNNKKGDTVAVYKDNSLYTNNPVGHSDLMNSDDSFAIGFGLTTMLTGIFAWPLFFYIAVLIRKLLVKIDKS